MSSDKDEKETKVVQSATDDKKPVEAKADVKPEVKADSKVNDELAKLQAANDELKKKLIDSEKKFEDADKNAEDWKNKYYGVYADMANTRKQVERENEDFKKYAQQKVIEELIPALDGFDMALKKSPNDEKIKSYLEGFEMIHSKILGVLKTLNVEIIDPQKGGEYDPNLMNAFSTIDGSDDNKVADVFFKGYKLYDHLLRPAGVVITKKAEAKKDEKTVVKDEKKDDKPKSQENK